MLLDLSSFDEALASLDRAAIRAQAAPADEDLRDAVIQRFEYTYELAWKMLKRHLEQVAGPCSNGWALFSRVDSRRCNAMHRRGSGALV
jgi:nucleotidyltransferase substrate binding protein (TIGR01987 family)